MHFHGALRIKNEARWIERVIKSLQPLCERILILDDHSTDGTPEICESIPGVTIFRSGFQGIDESRDKDFLLTKLYEGIPGSDLGHKSPHIACAIDGDEILATGGQDVLAETVSRGGYVWSPRIVYLWDSEDQYRIDGVYANFRRPSFFRMINPAFRYQRTPWGNGANFHCSSVPQEMLHHSTEVDTSLLHLGYLNRADRLRKYEWYNKVDPNNRGEDGYRHMVQGDLPEIPASARLMHAGPLTLQSF